MLKVFINRPVLSTVISIVIVILGILGLYRLPVERFPEIALPAVQVTAFYPGANAETILRTVAPPLEEAINGVENMSYMSSTSSNDGSLVITVFFELGTNADQAAVNVQNRISQANNQLPIEVLERGITTTKQQPSILMALVLYVDDEVDLDAVFLANYTEINILSEIKRIPGVGQAIMLGGSKNYSMRIWLDPAKMGAYNLTPVEVLTAIHDKNLETAPGRFGENSTEVFEYVIQYPGKFNQPSEFENIIIRATPEGSVLRLKDVARVELGAQTYSNYFRVNGKRGITLRILQLPGSNSNKTQIAITEFMEKAKKDFPKGVDYFFIYNTKHALDQSISQVKFTLAEAFILVFAVVLVFLQDFRTTIIPIITVPVSILGTFFFMLLFGFSINLLTLFALILSIGIVVDDAIVVVEAIHSKMERDNLSAKEATISTMSEITPVIISITLVMAAVFIPIGFMEGPTGIFYKQFAFTMSVAILLSAVNALTLSPALAVLFFKRRTIEEDLVQKEGFVTKFRNTFNTGFEGLTQKYMRSLTFLLKHKWIAFVGLVSIIFLSFIFIISTPTGFIPSEDQGFVAISLSMPPGTSLDRTSQTMLVAEKILENMEIKRELNIIPGVNILSGSTSPSSGAIFMQLQRGKDRGELLDIKDIMTHIREELSVIKGANFFVFTFPTVPGFGNVDALDIVLQDRGSGAFDKFEVIAQTFMAALRERPEIGVAFSTFRADFPQLKMVIDEEKAAQLQVSIREIAQTMQVYFGSAQASDFNRFGKYYRVIAQADIKDRTDLSAMDAIFVKNSFGNPVPINSLVSFERVYGPETASRYNLFNSIRVNALPATHFSSGDAIKAVEEVASQYLPSGYSFEFSGISREEISSGGQTVFIFMLSLLFVFFFLAAQYESYILPLAVMFSIPTGVLGVFMAIGLAGIENNIYVQVALIMLTGLIGKNAILIVEYAIQRRRAGKPLIEAALEAAKLRFRPIVMTSLAFTVGLIPMMRATGPSAQGNLSISIAAAGGMISGVVLGLLLTPVLFVVFQYIQEKWKSD